MTGVPGRLVIAPAILILAPVAISIAAWLLPAHRSGLTGFVDRAPLDAHGIGLMTLWLAAAALLATLGLAIGLRNGPIASLSRVSLDEWHTVTCLLGLVGTSWVYWTVTGGSLGALAEIWREQDFDRFAEDFEYGVGPATLRYAAIIAGGLSAARVVCGRRLRALDVVSLLLLTGTVMLSSRLSALMAATVAAAVVVLGPGARAVRVGRLAVAVTLFVALFVVANYSRNGDVYEAAGVRNPVEMAALNAQAYLATPAQVTALVSARAMDGTIEPPEGAVRALGPVLPVFAQSRLFPDIEDVKDVEGNVETRYQGTVDLTKSYTTNGAVPDMLVGYGWLSLATALVMFGVAGWLAGLFGASGPIGASVAGVLLYGFAETWRVYLFNQGSVAFLVLLGGLAVMMGLLRGSEFR